MSTLLFLCFAILTSGVSESSTTIQDNSQERPFGEITTYYFIRHAEKISENPGEKDPALTKQGRIRAKKWAEVFKEVPLNMIYSSNYIRTRQTAQPCADAKNLEIQLYNTEKLNDEDFQQKTKGKTVLIVGHNNTTPQFVNAVFKRKEICRSCS